MPFFDGLGYGIATVLLIGPVFFTLLKAALDHGATGGVVVAFGIIVSDILVVAICLSGVAALLELSTTAWWMAVAAGTILLVLGIRYIVGPVPHVERPIRATRRTNIGLFTSGFLVNFVNPFVLAIWVALVIHARNAHGDGLHAFLLGALTGIFLTDIGKAYLAHSLRPLLRPRTLKRVSLVIGVILLLFSVRVFIHAARIG